MEYLEIKNWSKYQHYKDRNPPWIKLHYEILISEDWVMLADASKALLIACMLLASRNEGKIPYNTDYIKRACNMEYVDLQPLIKSGFLVDASKCSQMLASASTKTETETEKKKTCAKLPYTDDFNKFWEEYPRQIQKRVAFEKWIQVIKTNTPDDLISAAREYAAVCKKNKTEEQFISHPATFLNKDRWKDYCFAEETA